MIDWNASAAMNKCSVEELKSWVGKYPKSAKRMVAICDGCDKERFVDFNAYRDLCNECAHRTPEYRKKRSKIAIGIFSTQESRDNMSQAKKKYYANNPDARELHRQLAIKQFSTPEAREAMRLRAIDRFSTQESRDVASAKILQYYEDHPEAREAARLRGTEQFSTQESRNEMSEIMKNSNIHKDAVKKMVGGNDVVGHHMIYDHADLSKNIIHITRSTHMRLHRLFQKHGIEIPHINIGGR